MRRRLPSSLQAGRNSEAGSGDGGCRGGLAGRPSRRRACLVWRPCLCAGEPVHRGVSAMSLLPRLRSSRTRESEALQQRVSAVQTALQQCGQAAKRLKTFRRETMAAGAVFMLAAGFALGVYRDSIMQSITGLGQAIGLAAPPAGVDAAHAAYQKGDYPTVLRLA